jgi:hypothetical protein
MRNSTDKAASNSTAKAVRNSSEIDDEMDDELPVLKLGAELTELIAVNPSVFADEITEIKQSIILLHWRAIIARQIEKAKKGETASAKFLEDYISTIVDKSEQSMGSGGPVLWEEKAIEIRDKLGADKSAEEIVEIILTLLASRSEVNLLDVSLANKPAIS